MKPEKLKLYVSLVFLLVVGFGLINLVVFVEMRDYHEEQLYLLANWHAERHFYNLAHSGDDQISINPPQETGYRIYIFKDPNDLFKTVKVGVKEEQFQEEREKFIRKLFLLEFVLVFTLVFLYQAVVESYIRKLREKEEWTRSLMLSLTHRLGNFLATQRVLLALLEKNYPEEGRLRRLEKSLAKAQRDFNIFKNVAREDRGLEPELLNLKEHVQESLKYFEEELERKKLFLNLKDMKVRMDRMDLEDVLYNLIGNAVKHSKSFVHIRICQKSKTLVVSNDVGRKDSSGMGMGAELLRTVLKRYRYQMTVRMKARYTVFLRFT